jgi:gliding motility-associated-like protein
LKDLNGDGRPEMIVANAIANSISVFLNNGSGLFLAPMIYPTENYPTTLSVADMDNDGKLDLVVGNANSGTITAFPGDGAGGFGASKNFSVGGQPYSIATGDFDEDGNLDVVSVDLSSNKITLLRTLSNTCLPNIASFSPISGPAGTSVVISGMNFSSIPANNVVMFNGATAIVTASTSMSITTTVPIGATTGNITLTIGSNTATSTTSFCVPPTAPIQINNSGCSGTSISISASGGTPGQYRWYTAVSGGTPDTQQNATFNTPALTNTTSFWVAINDGTCESARTEVIATVLPLPTSPVVQPVNPVCPGSDITITATGGTDGEYRWYDGATIISGAVNSTLDITNLTSAKTFSASIHDGTCESNKTSVVASVKSCTAPSVESTVATAFVNGIVAINLENLISDPEGDLDPASLQIIEQPQSGAPATLEGFNLNIDYSSIAFSGTDRVTVGICDLTNLCTEQAVTIELGGAIKIYNAVSPNGDGKNEIFFIQYIDLLPETQRNTVSIYNRWGDEVFYVKNYNNTSNVFKGDGKNGQRLPAGTYFYKIVFASGKSRTGFLELKY